MVQLSVNSFEGFDEHFELGTRLDRLRRDGVLIVGSGNVVHNLGRVDMAVGDRGFDWTVRFDEQCTTYMLEDPARTRDLDRHPDYGLAVPTPDHFLPLAPIAGLAHAAGTPASVLVDGYVAGALSMTSYRVG
ncbi:MAG TPA: class III extradiol ring-cleavage dioxygenase [Acidimicrobiales bacterium]|nr:class III extradiol ring-cleavage dioxygenase [Acidimicrobiales bacterium]